jgi:GT2 family glycosyltransferase
MHAQKTYIVLVNWNGWRDTILCLESVLRLNHPDFVVVVCDNASSDQSMDHIKRWCSGQLPASGGNPELAALTTPPQPKPVPFLELERKAAESGAGDATQVLLIHTGANLGFAGGNNVGFRYALARGDADYVWALNNDTVVPPDSLAELITRMQTDGNIGICGSTVRFMARPQVIQACGGAAYNPWTASNSHIGLGVRVDRISKNTAAIEHRLSYVFGASMLTSSAFLRTTGLMQEDYFLFFEELDWAERAKRAGFGLGYAQDSHVFHKAGSATGSAEESAFSIYYLNRNRLKFIWRFYTKYFVLNYLALWYELAKALLKGRIAKAKGLSCALLGIPLYTPPVSHSRATCE